MEVVDPARVVDLENSQQCGLRVNNVNVCLLLVTKLRVGLHVPFRHHIRFSITAIHIQLYTVSMMRTITYYHRFSPIFFSYFILQIHIARRFTITTMTNSYRYIGK